MQQPIHAIMQPGARWTTERIVGVSFVGLLHVIAITAVLTGLTPTITRFIDRPIHLIPVKTEPVLPPKPVQLIEDSNLPKLAAPVIAPKPDFTVEQDKADQIPGSKTDTPPQPPAADTYATGIVNTHTIPGYPPIARKLGEQGSVRLALTIAADGNVVAADVVQSSGFADLDSIAVMWVMSHWKYKPAIRGGVAVASQAPAMVVFNLKNAR